MMTKKSKQLELDEWVIAYLRDEKVLSDKDKNNMKELKPDKIPWKCPDCGQKWRFILPINMYVGSYVFECDKCGEKQRIRTNHFNIN